jgi:hypothetical protein
MNPILFKLLMTLGIETLKYLRRHYESLSPEQKAALLAAVEKNFSQAGSMGSGVGE